ncbi:hypothetical protein ACOMCU_15880 [Lysinibacillus sp. UGB7]|uniref:hypothetical protein n=1 Tax=Lysinibacillus sp. UGB7 TaxID=3411039 RepID=UPI003B7C11CA
MHFCQAASKMGEGKYIQSVVSQTECFKVRKSGMNTNRIVEAVLRRVNFYEEKVF